MSKFNVFISIEVSKMIEIEANDADEAERRANEKWDYTNDIEFDIDKDYVPDSFQVNLVEE